MAGRMATASLPYWRLHQNQKQPGVDACPNADVGAVGAFMNGFAAACDDGFGEACEKGLEADEEVADGAAPFARSIRFGWTSAPSSI
jgi:hypothetical protein